MRTTSYKLRISMKEKNSKIHLLNARPKLMNCTIYTTIFSSAISPTIKAKKHTKYSSEISCQPKNISFEVRQWVTLVDCSSKPWRSNKERIKMTRRCSSFNCSEACWEKVQIQSISNCLISFWYFIGYVENQIVLFDAICQINLYSVLG